MSDLSILVGVAWSIFMLLLVYFLAGEEKKRRRKDWILHRVLYFLLLAQIILTVSTFLLKSVLAWPELLFAHMMMLVFVVAEAVYTRAGLAILLSLLAFFLAVFLLL
ncbi:MAG: hypothetical protein QXF97_06500 [Candidatus Caldarchaeum sp.]